MKCLIVLAVLLVTSLSPGAGAAASRDADSSPTATAPLARAFDIEVSPRLRPPPDVVAAYSDRLRDALAAASVRPEGLQFIALVDRAPHVQALFVYWGSADDGWVFVGAAPVSTGLPGRYEHFATPLGVFEHSSTNPDYRAEGTKNVFGIRGYGVKGSRVYDFGWVRAPKGWGDGANSVMRLQMHSTDPDVLEPRLGTAQSKGCIRIPATLNEFFDRRGLLDADYQEEIANGASPWVLRVHRDLTDWPGRWLVVVDSATTTRPRWAAPRGPRRAH